MKNKIIKKITASFIIISIITLHGCKGLPNTMDDTKSGTTTPAPTTTTTITTIKATSTKKPLTTAYAKSGFTAFQSKVISLVNKERAKKGLKALASYAKLNNMATAKSEDMAKNNYFSHNSPKYGSPFEMMRRFGITYRSAGENIAKGQTTPEQVMKSWMNSSGHRANILKSSFTKIGVGVVKNSRGQILWTQEFIG